MTVTAERAAITTAADAIATNRWHAMTAEATALADRLGTPKTEA